MIKERRKILKILSPYLLSGKDATDCMTGVTLSFHGNQGKNKTNNALKRLLIKLANGRIIEVKNH